MNICNIYIFLIWHRFWETDLRTVRKTNRSTMRHPRARGSIFGGGGGASGGAGGRDKFSGWVQNTWRTLRGNSFGTDRPWTNSHISRILYNFVFCWIIEPEPVYKACGPELALGITSWGQVNLAFPAFVCENAWTQFEKVNDEGIYVVGVHRSRLVHK